ncbi:MAG: putative lipid II flippase FtsW [Acidobacteria bacterium]|nr:putative lipid II flippase FtsW [Acidobacteriota bacterium]MCW5970521.1 putative lipid II flippase FtsW [Blastocatellales bacterium]
MIEQATHKGLEKIDQIRWDLWLAAAAVGLVFFGVVMVYSASAGARDAGGFLIGQLRWAALGLVVMAVLMRLDYHIYARPTIVYGLFLLCVVLLVAVFFFEERNGAHRWISFWGISGQPSELAKLTLIIFLSWFLTQRQGQGVLDSFTETLLPATVIMGVMAALIMKEPDLGTTAMLGLIFAVMMFVAGVPVRHLLKFIPVVIAGGYLFIFRVGWRWDRIVSFMNPDLDPEGKGYQLKQSLIAVGSGGVHGLGLGQSRQKLNFLPEAQSDFIFAVVSEELGMIGAATVVIVFAFVLWRGLRACHRAPDRFGYLLALGLTTMIIAQAFFNMSVVLSLAPTKGIPLPFISAGGSSLVVTLAAVGILLNISEWGRARPRVNVE